MLAISNFIKSSGYKVRGEVRFLQFSSAHHPLFDLRQKYAILTFVLQMLDTFQELNLSEVQNKERERQEEQHDAKVILLL